MLKKERLFTRKTALGMILACAAVLLLLILLRWHGGSQPDLATAEGREQYLLSLGWEVDGSTEEHKSVLIPDTLEGVMEDYNKMQLSQDSYQVTNYRGYDGTVLVTIYIQGREVIAGDIHTTALDGFMHGIKRDAEGE